MLRPSRSEEKTRTRRILCVLSLVAFELSWVKKGRRVSRSFIPDGERSHGICRRVTGRRQLALSSNVDSRSIGSGLARGPTRIHESESMWAGLQYWRDAVESRFRYRFGTRLLIPRPSYSSSLEGFRLFVLSSRSVSTPHAHQAPS